MMKWAVTLGTALLAEAAGHFLSMSWGFMILVFAFIYTGIRMSAATAKSASTEARVNALVPALGSATNTANTANSTANSAQSLANTVDSRTSGLSIPQSRPGGLLAAPSSYTLAWGQSVVTFCTQGNNQLQAAGVFV